VVKGKNKRLDSKCQDNSARTHECGKEHTPEDNFFTTSIKEGSSTADYDGSRGTITVEQVPTSRSVGRTEQVVGIALVDENKGYH
jgi:hypothetical protein